MLLEEDSLLTKLLSTNLSNKLLDLPISLNNFFGIQPRFTQVPAKFLPESIRAILAFGLRFLVSLINRRPALPPDFIIIC